MTEIVTKKPLKFGMVNIPVGTKISGLPEGIIKELTTRAFVNIVPEKAEEAKVEKPHKERKTETGF